jgi:hypothetical protein
VLPRVAPAQQQLPVVGFLNSGSPDGYAPMVAGFREGLREAGYLEGQNVTIEFRWAEGQYERVPGIAAELIRRHVAVFVANTPGVYTVKAATATIPNRVYDLFRPGADRACCKSKPSELRFIAGNVTSSLCAPRSHVLTATNERQRMKL